MIPEMTNPLGAYWDQPDDIRDVLIDDEHALLTQHQQDQLTEYSSSIPSGVYPGKCWKRKEANWLLCWYGEIIDGRCSFNALQIIVVN